jgi:hypothetical protein
VPIKIVAGFRLLRVFEIAHVFGLAVGKSLGAGKPFAMPPLGLFSGRSKVHKFSHSTP